MPLQVQAVLQFWAAPAQWLWEAWIYCEIPLSVSTNWKVKLEFQKMNSGYFDYNEI